MMKKMLSIMNSDLKKDTLYVLLGADKTAQLEIQSNLKKAKVIDSQQFINEFINSIISNSIPTLPPDIKEISDLIINDFHLFVGKEAAQTELGRIIDTILAKDGKVILLSRYSFNLISELDLPLRERLLHHSIWFNF